MRLTIRLSVNALLLSLLMLPLWLGTAEAQVLSGALRGDYNVTLTRSCAVSPFGGSFNSSLQPLDHTGAIAAPGSHVISIRGTVNFNGAGTGTFTGDTFVIGGGAPINRASQSCNLTYSVNADGTFTQTLNCNLTYTAGTIAGVAAAGNTATLNGVALQGQLAQDGTTLLLSSTVPTAETFTCSTCPTGVLPPGVTTFTFQRLCEGTGIATSRR